MQIVFLITDLERGMLLIKSSGIINSLIKFLRKYVEDDPSKRERDDSKLTFVEEILVINIILKVLINDNKLLGDFVSSGGIDFFLEIYELGECKRYLDDIILNTFSYCLKDIQYCDVIEEILRKVFISIRFLIYF